MKTRYEIDLPLSELLRRGVQVVGMFVVAESSSVRAWPSQDPHARRRLVGQVVSVDGGRVLVRSYDGEMAIDPARTWIESTRPNFQAVMRKACGRSFERDLVVLDEVIAGFTNAERRIEDTARIASRLLGLGQLDIADGMEVRHRALGRHDILQSGGGSWL